MKTYTIRLFLMLLLALPYVVPASAQRQEFPAWCITTANLNIRTSDYQSAPKIATVPRGSRLQVQQVGSNGWAMIIFQGRTAYCSARYLRYDAPVAAQQAPQQSRASSDSGSSGSTSFWSVVFSIAIIAGILAVLRKVLIVVLGLASVFFYKFYRLISFPFYVLNSLQRYLYKPWLPFYKRNTRSDGANKELREQLEVWKIPLYIIVTPLRFVNAVYFNILVHCSFELFNYLVEVIVPESEDEGGDNFLWWTVMLPVRVAKYLVWHGGLTFIESCVWTAIDTFVPALTLYHGTTCAAAESITQGPGRVGPKGLYSGVWNVGGGNFAGNGIYFAPARSTALHYSSGSLIVCRVSLGRTLDLGLAPRHIYNQCGAPNALGVTRWGLDNNYVTGEWWRGDARAGWWEYCMYDWQNRYNHSWRIRPLYVLDLSDECIQRIPGGMVHWLFREMVMEDLLEHISTKM